MLIDENGEKRGKVGIEEALAAARAAGLDLVEVADNPDLPVVKILDYGKVRFENQKKKAAAKKRQRPRSSRRSSSGPTSTPTTTR